MLFLSQSTSNNFSNMLLWCCNSACVSVPVASDLGRFRGLTSGTLGGGCSGGGDVDGNATCMGDTAGLEVRGDSGSDEVGEVIGGSTLEELPTVADVPTGRNGLPEAAGW